MPRCIDGALKFRLHGKLWRICLWPSIFNATATMNVTGAGDVSDAGTPPTPQTPLPGELVRHSNLLNTIWKRYVLGLTAGVLVLCLAVCIFFSVAASFAVFCSYAGGMFLICGIYGSRFQHFLRCISSRPVISSDTQPVAACTVCLKVACRRHDSTRSGPYRNEPWEKMTVAAEVDASLEEFLNLTLEKYIYLWHQAITDDGAFLYELKHCIRFAVAILFRRAAKVDLSKLITRKLLKVGFSHLDCCLQANLRKGEKNSLEEAVFDYYGADLHVAAYGRRCESQYLRGLSERILPLVLPARLLQCKSFMYLIEELISGVILLSIMDAIADPDIINGLLLVFFDKTPMINYPPTTDPQVCFLEHFLASTPSRSHSRLSDGVTTDPSQQSYLYPLMKFMKSEESIGILQFCLAIDDFNTRLLNPDLKDDDLRLLHEEASKLYEIYMAPHGVDRLNFDQDVVDEFRSIVESPYSDIVRLQTTEPLFKAHEYAFRLLEKHLPLFCQSEEYYEYLCGPRLRGKSSQSLNSKSSKGSNLSTAAKLGNKINKIRGVLMPSSAIDGRIDDSQSDLADAGFEADELKLDIDSNFCDMDELSLRDLSAWRVSIPRVDSQRDSSNKVVYSFIIDVQRIDVTNKDNPDEFHWRVERQHHEFYVLEAKLTEFHGEFADARLPSKRSFGSKGYDYMEARRAAFEEFLQRLLQKPTFRGSELLFMFLSSTGDFTKGLLPDINLGKMIKTVPMKLLKEKGQHLETFLQAFVTSAESAKPKPSKTEYKDVHSYPQSTSTRTLRKSIFADNAGRRLDHSPVTPLRFQSVLKQEGLCDYILYLSLKVLKVPKWSMQMIFILVHGFRTVSEAMVEHYLGVLLRKALVPQRIVILIRLLKDVVFTKEPSKRNQEEREARGLEALAKVRSFLPSFVVRIIGRDRHHQAMGTLFEMLQHPRINKQLAYALLDVLVAELFPELDEAESGGEAPATSFGNSLDRSNEPRVRAQ